ncbi:MAG: energy transducer TonB [Gemmatimonadota bacterium]|nr:MAG: energy transducer TonB [Gemmatimonadota bacterium]
MIRKINQQTIVSWAMSLAVHTLILVFLLIIKVYISPEIPEYSEMDFVSVPTVTSPAHAQVPPVSTPSAEEIPQVKLNEEPENLVLPKMKHLLDEQPELIEKKIEKVAPTEKPFGGKVEPSAITPEREESYPVAQKTSADQKPTPDAQRLVLSEKTLTGTDEETGESRDRPYTIEGAASTRQVITEVLPEYPPGLNKEAVIKIRFTVLPNGTVGEMVPILKGDTTLEELTMKAFRQWRFNHLPPDLPQEPQSGVITFRYILK